MAHWTQKGRNWTTRQKVEEKGCGTVVLDVGTLGGSTSEADKEGTALFNPALDSFFVETLEDLLPTEIGVKELDCHISDSEFAHRAVEWLAQMIHT